jgi:hypothetical protein
MDDHFKQMVMDAKAKKNPGMKPNFLNKKEDPLIRAETEKKVKEHRVMLE